MMQENHYYPFGLKMEGKWAPQIGKENMYGYNDKELNNEFGLNWNDYGARFYDSAIGRFLSNDPGSELYYSISNFAYVANNPMNFIDPTGAVIEDPDGIVDNYRNQVNTQLDAINNLLNLENVDFSKIGASREDFEQVATELGGVLNELDALEGSSQVYKVGFSDQIPANEGGVSFDNSDNSVKVEIGRNASIGLVSQELLHAYQFESRKLSISYDNSAYGSLYDITDETATYRRDHLITNGALGLQTIDNITDDSTIRQGAGLVPPAYQNLPRRDISINSPEGLRMMKRNLIRKMSRGPVKSLPKEVFKGWDQ